MKIIFEICAFIVLVGIPAQLFYWCVIRPTLLAKIDMESTKLHKRLDLLGQTISKDHKHALPIVDQKCANLSRWLNEVDAFILLTIQIPVETKLRIERDREIIADAPHELREINKDIEMMITSAAIINSPGLITFCLLLLPIVALVGICCLVTNKVRAAWEFIARPFRVGLYLSNNHAPC